MKNKVELSVIIPAYKEGEDVRFFLEELIANLDELKKSYEILFLDNDTEGNSDLVMKEFGKKYPNFRGYTLVHPGTAVLDKSNKYTFGFQKARGEIIIHMDADGQDRPEELSKFLAKLDEGYDMVVGRKVKRKDSFLYKFPSAVLNFIIRTITGVKVHDMNNGFKAYKAKVAKSLDLYSGNFRYIPIILTAAGYRITEIPVKHLERKFGSGKFNFISRFKGGIFDLISILLVTRPGKTPLYFYGWIALLKGLASFLLFVAALLYFDRLMVFTILLFLSGLTFMTALMFLLFGITLENVKALTARSHLEPILVKEY